MLRSARNDLFFFRVELLAACHRLPIVAIGSRRLFCFAIGSHWLNILLLAANGDFYILLAASGIFFIQPLFDPKAINVPNLEH